MITVLYVILGVIVAGCAVLFIMSATARRPTTIGVTNGKLASVPESPNCVSTTAVDDVHAIEPFRFSGNADEAISSLRSIVSSFPGALVIKESDGYLYAEFRSKIFRYVDDVEFLIDSDNQTVHFRSASRVGYSDMGVNRSRMEQIRRRFQN